MLLTLLACSDYDLQTDPPVKQEPVPEETTPETTPPPEEPDIHVTPDIADFGDVLRDCPAEPIVLTIENLGQADLDVTDIVLSGDAASKFTLTAAPALLAYGESTTATIEFTPTAWVTYEVAIDITSNDPDEAVVTVPTLGTGADAGIYEESFTQEYQPAIDVLWVVDNSGSMSESQKKVRDSFDDFMSVFLGLGLDYHLGVISTDMDDPSQSAQLLGSPNYIDSTYADPTDWFRTTANLGAGGSADEKGLEAAKMALSEPLKSGDNAGFQRSTTALAVIVLSDENDASSLSAASFASWFEGLRSDKDLTTFNAIVGDSGLGCFSTDISATGGDEYIDVADATDGVFVSICSTDYRTAMTNLSQASAGMKLEFPLARTPSDVSRIEVEVDGVTVPTDTDNGWTYDTGDNAIQFHGSSVPDAGAVIDVSYPVAGSC